MNLEGQRFGEFEILERLGQGGMGAVYRAVQTSLQRTVAIKTLQPALAGDPEYIERFHREAIAAAALIQIRFQDETKCGMGLACPGHHASILRQ